MAFELPSLPYSKTALAAKGMCEETLDLHHGKHHQAYVTALNGFVEKDASLQGKSLDDIVKATDGGRWPGVQQRRPALEPHHLLAVHEPDGRRHPGQAGERRSPAISARSAKFKDAFKAGGVGQFGSGWVWLVLGTTAS